MILKTRWENYKNIVIFCIVFMLFLICFIICNIFWNSNQENKEEWVNISDFSTNLEIDKE
jgi:NADH:ubiquinone oxidoreductase subunit 5 (subunit L)/multisubunit Na+/H+ antiporter MnhA subunit